MSGLQGLRVYISQRLTAAVDDILGHLETTIREYEEETERRHRDLLGSKQRGADVQQLVVRTGQERTSRLQQEEAPHIKEEQEEADITEFSFSRVPVKSEDDEDEAQSSQLHHSQTEDTTDSVGGQDCGGLGPVIEDRTSDCSDPKIEVSVDDCEATWEPRSALSGELPVSDGWKSFRCSECGKGFGSPSYLKLHMRCHTGERPYSCPVCTKCFSWSGRLQKHMRIHTGEKPFGCSVCSKTFNESGNLKVHMRIHTGEKPFSCSVCGKKYAQRGNLKQHMAVHRGEATFSCRVCRRRFTWLWQLNSHQCGGQASHPRHTEDSRDFGGPEPGQGPVPSQTNHQTSHCYGREAEDGGVSVSRPELNFYEKSFGCSECEKMFVSRGQLKAHMRAHTGEKPFRCSVCRKSFSWNGCLQKHLKIHTGEKPYSCSVCGKGFIENGNLKVHMRIHTGEKPFSCSVCGKRYRQKGSLTKHLEVHRGGT